MKQKTHLVNQCKIFVFTLGIITVLMACGDKKQTNENLQQAFELHQEAMKIRQMTDNQITKLKANKDSLFVETYAKDLDSFSRLLNDWDQLFVEVPGFEETQDHSGHDHHDHSGHDHHHSQEFTPKQHLEVQQYLLKEIKAIAEKVNTIK